MCCSAAAVVGSGVLFGVGHRSLLVDMALSAFKAKSSVVARLVACSDQLTWSTPTWCGRLLLQDGSECEFQATGQCRDHMMKLEIGLCISMEVPRSCVKPYTQSSRTGIVNKYCIKASYPLSSLSRTVTSFAPDVVARRDFTAPADLDQAPEVGMQCTCFVSLG